MICKDQQLLLKMWWGKIFSVCYKYDKKKLFKSLIINGFNPKKQGSFFFSLMLKAANIKVRVVTKIVWS